MAELNERSSARAGHPKSSKNQGVRSSEKSPMVEMRRSNNCPSAEMYDGHRSGCDKSRSADSSSTITSKWTSNKFPSSCYGSRLEGKRWTPSARSVQTTSATSQRHSNVTITSQQRHSNFTLTSQQRHNTTTPRTTDGKRTGFNPLRGKSSFQKSPSVT